MNIVKSVLCLLLSLMLLLCLSGCIGETTPTDPPTTLPQNAVLVTTPEELVTAFEKLRTGAIVTLGADIDMTGVTLRPVKQRSFSINGNGYTISNLHSQGVSGLLVDNGGDRTYHIYDLTLKNCSVSNPDGDFAALFVGTARDSDAVTISNCRAVDCNVVGGNFAALFISYTAGLGESSRPIPMTVETCYAENCTVTGGGSTGIAIGHAGGNPQTKNIITGLTAKNVTVNGGDASREGLVVGTAHVGIVEISQIDFEGCTLTKNTGEGIYRYFGRYLPAETGSLIIDGEAQ